MPEEKIATKPSQPRARKSPPKPATAPATSETKADSPAVSGAPAPSPAPAAPSAPARAKRPSPAPAPAGVVIDASGLVLGRAASVIAKRLLAGESIVVVNAEKSVVTGSRASVLEEYRARRARGSKRSGPHYPRYPDRIFRRTVRGMVPHLKTRGKVAMDRLAVHIGLPADLANQPRETLERARARPSLRTPITLEEITRLLGARL